MLKALKELVSKTVFIDERINGSFIFEGDHEDIIDDYINKWHEVVAKGDSKTFEKRLSLDNLDLNSVRNILGTISFNEHLPEWTEIFEEIINKEVLEKKYITCNSDARDAVPFQEILYPFVLIARKELLKTEITHLASEESFNTFERNLLRLLSNLCAETLYYEYIIYCTGKQPSYELYLDQARKRVNPEYYSNFIEDFFNDSFINFFSKYPVMARFVSSCIKLWIEGTCEFFTRLEEDLPEISRVFCKGEKPGKVVQVKPGISDTHNRGRSAIAITFSSGLKLIYKPKDLSTEIVYFKILSWFNEHISLKFKTLKIINRLHYGWVEFVEHRPCNNKEEVKNYYRRMGHFLCVIYVMGGSDCHCENIIASGEYPVFVDLETLMQAYIGSDNKEYKDRACVIADNKLTRSVLKTGLLPNWVIQENGEACDISGISGPSIRRNSVLREKENLSDRQILTGTERFRNVFNLPVLSGELIMPFEYIDSIVNGFREIYMLVIEHRDYLLSSHSILNELQSQKFRFIYRGTRVYNMLFRKLLRPVFLKDAILFSIELDVITRAILKFEQNKLYPLIKSEISSIERLDIPVFTGYSDRNDLILPDGHIIENVFEEPAYSRIITCVKGAGHEDMAWQISLIRGALYEKTKSVEICHGNIETGMPSIEEEALSQVLLLAEHLERLAICSDPGEATWIGYEYMPGGDILQLRPAGYNMYSGCCGISLFLAALARVTHNNRFHRLALSAVEATCRDIKDKRLKDRVMENGTGGLVGLGSIVYSLVSVSQFLGASKLIETAKIASLLIKDLITSDNRFDITGGSAGALLALLKLYDLIHEREILEIARKCGSHLLEKRVKSSTGYRAWKTAGNHLLSGFSHGVSGIAYALLRLYSYTEEKDLLEAAKEAILYENTLYSKHCGNWLDLREAEDRPEEKRFKNSWCHGAPGIGLGRIGGLFVLDSEEIRKDIDISIERTIKTLLDCDYLCCGNFGLVDILLTAAMKLDRSDLKKEALLKASLISGKAKERGFFNTGYENDFCAGFFQGISGIGYELIRLNNPDIPSVLLLE